MKKPIALLLLASRKQRIYQFYCPYEAYHFGVKFDGTVEITEQGFIVTI